jgi:hydroxyacylglutathione hydrolase
VNCYLLVNSSGESILIDPGSAESQVLKIVKNKNLKILGIINTHAHFDHIISVQSLQKKLNCDFYLHSNDNKLLRRANLYRTVFGSTEFIKIPIVNYYVDKISKPFKLGNFVIDVVHTPGHTEGSVSLLIGDYLFTGDLIFKGNIGRIDLPGGDYYKMKQSLNLLAKFSPKLKLLPGHGEPTTIENELKSNLKFIGAIK